MANPTVLLTGGTGFIGHHTVEHLLINTDWRIVVLDSLTYAGDPAKLLDIEGYDPLRVKVVWHDLRAPIGAQTKNLIGDVDYIINMASASHVDRSIAEPAEFIMNNTAIAVNMLEYAREVKPEKFIQVSTDEVYGPAPDGYSHKEWDVILPSNPYAASKAAQEAIAISYWRTYGVPVIITNTMNNFGERQNSEKFVPLVIRKLIDSEPVTVHGTYRDGLWESGSRVWLHSRNHADAMLFLLKNISPNVFPIQDRPTRFNVAGEKEISNSEIVEMIAELLGVTPAIERVDFHSSRPGHDLRYSLDGTALVQMGWTAPIPLYESFANTVQWTVENREWLLNG